jgi:hypothetical protein
MESARARPLAFRRQLLLDAVFALYTVAVVKNQAGRAASLSLATYFLEAFGVVSFVENKAYLLPLAAGAFVGSFVIVKREANKADKKKARKIKRAI